MNAPDMLDSAAAWHDAGCSVVRVAADGTKRPLGEWKQYQDNRADAATVNAWFVDGHPGIGVVCGAVSGDLEMLELEGRAVTGGIGARFFAALDDNGLTEEKNIILAGCCDLSPSGGMHFFYRVIGGVGGNTKLARRPGPEGSRTVDTLIETRGEGGFVVVAPSHGDVHETGKPWTLGAGSPATIPIITAEQRDALHAVACTLDEMPPPEPMPDPIPMGSRDSPGGTAPGTDYNERATWEEILTPAGWTLVRRLADRAYWRRPGKNLGISAVTGGAQGDYFYCWSTSTELPAEQAMSKWRVYTFLSHGGDFQAAAKKLKNTGYGKQAPEPRVSAISPIVGFVDGTAVEQPAIEAETFRRSDDGNAQALVDYHGDVIRYCSERGRWLHWTGVRWKWQESDDGAVRELAKLVARALPEDDNNDVRHKQHSLSARGTTAILMQARTDSRIAVSLEQLDADPYELNTPAGVVDLRVGTIQPHDPRRLHTRLTAVAPDFDADVTQWRQFLGDTFDGHADLSGYLQRLVGYSVTGVVREHVLPFAFGPGANGKGVFLETLRGVLGDYATKAPSRFLMAQVYNGHETEIARLAGARMVICSEVNEGDRFDEAKVKELTGGDTLTARFMRQDHFTFVPTHKLWLMGNHQPTVNGGGHSFWRRLRIIPFDNTVAEEKQVEDLQTILAHEHGGAVLAWIIAGATDYFAGGLAEPSSVRSATAKYAHDQDTVTRFVEDVCQLGGGELVKLRKSDVRRAYESWCSAEGATPVPSTAFTRALKTKHGVGEDSGRRFYTGISLYSDDDESNEA